MCFGTTIFSGFIRLPVRVEELTGPATFSDAVHEFLVKDSPDTVLAKFNAHEKGFHGRAHKAHGLSPASVF